MQVSNQKPAVLSPVYKANITGDFEPTEYLKQTLVTPLYNPVIPGQAVSISNNGTAITEDMITSNILSCCGNVINATAEAVVKTIFEKTLVYFDKNTNLNIQNTFSIQAAVKEKLPFPTDKVVYTPATDVIPVSKEFLAGKCDYEKYFATLAFYARPNTLGFYFANDKAFDAFKTWLNTQITTISPMLDAQTNQMFNDFFANTTLTELTESLLLRNTDSDNNHEYSFARTLIAYMMNYATQVSNAEFGVLPFDLGELYCPKTVVFVNVEKHTHATAKEIADEWNIINSSIQKKINMISNNKLTKLTTATRNLHKISAAASNVAMQMHGMTQRSANIKFRKTAPNTVDVMKLLLKVIKHMSTVAKSENSYKYVKMSYARPNRRNPDDFNKQGKLISTKYKPDLHVYIDTSGSISEINYQGAIKTCIKIAKKLNVNLYFNSFSHVLSQCTKLHTKDKSVKAIYNEFQKVPKVDGGTNYEQIWHYINKSKQRQRELSIIITDFGYYAPNHFVKHPTNLYYIPCSRIDWDEITKDAKSFCDSMKHIDPNCRKHLLF